MSDSVGPTPIWPLDVRRLVERLERLRQPAAVRRQRILITGASSGLGAQMARVWAADGRDLALCARRRDELEALRDELSAAHPEIRVEVYQLDVNDPGAVDFVFAVAAKDLGGLDRVVANAGIGKGAPIGTGYGWANRATLQTNAVGTLNQAENAIELFRAANAGHFVLISSVAALRGMGGARSSYASSKAAVSALAEGLRSELHRTPISVSAVHPGYINTAINRRDVKKKWAMELEPGTELLVGAIEAELPESYVPWTPWGLLAKPLQLMPLSLFRRLAD